MDAIRELIKKHPWLVLILPTSLGGTNLIFSFFSSIGDAVVTHDMLHKAMAIASLLQILILVVIIFVLKKN